MAQRPTRKSQARRTRTTPPREPASNFEATLHRMGKGGTIALIVVIVVLLAGAGLLAGALMEQEVDLEREPVAGEVGSPTALVPGSTGGILLSLKSALAQVPGPSPSPIAPAPGGGSGHDLGRGVTIPLPQPWVVVAGEPGTSPVLLTDQANGWATWFTGTTDPARDATEVVLNAFDELVFSQENASDLQVGEIAALQPFGSVVSWATMPYTGVWTDNQGAAQFFGEIYVAVRNDGTLLIGLLEALPAEAWDATLPNLGTLLGEAVQTFAGAPFPTG